MWGRTPGPKGVAPVWGNPFKLDSHGSREGVVKLFRNFCTTGALGQDAPLPLRAQ